MTSLRRRVEYLWKTAGNRSGNFVEEDERSQKCRGSRRDRPIVSVHPFRSFACRQQPSVACLIVNEIEEIINAGGYVRDAYVSSCFSARFALARKLRAARETTTSGFSSLSHCKSSCRPIIARFSHKNTRQSTLQQAGKSLKHRSARV